MKKRNHYLYLALMMGFILGIKDGYIALWKEGAADPSHVFPYRAEVLPPQDQKALEKGIYLEDDSQLIRLLEDYLS